MKAAPNAAAHRLGLTNKDFTQTVQMGIRMQIHELRNCNAEQTPSDSGFDCGSDSGLGQIDFGIVLHPRDPTAQHGLHRRAWNCFVRSPSGLTFIKAQYAVKYKTDGGELIEVWTPGKDVLVLEGMHGIMTFSTRPEKILSFRVVEQKLTE